MLLLKCLVFQLENIDFRSTVSGPSALFFNVSETTFSFLRLENASFVEFLSSETNQIGDINGTINHCVVSLRCLASASNNQSHHLAVVFRDVRFENNSDSQLSSGEAVGAQIDLDLGSNPSTTLAVTLERVEARNCSTVDFNSAIVIIYSLQNSTILFDSVVVEHCSSTWIPGVNILRNQQPNPLLSTFPGQIVFRNCSFHNTSIPFDIGQATVNLWLNGETAVHVLQSSFQFNMHGARSNLGAQALNVDFGIKANTMNASQSTLELLIDDSTFVSDGSLVGSGVSIQHGLSSKGTNVTIRNSLFQGHTACSDCSGDGIDGGAVRYAASGEADAACVVERHNWLLFDNCSFFDNSASRGGAIAISTGCLHTNTVKIARSIFEGNSAASKTNGNGGALFVDQDIRQETLLDRQVEELVIEDCDFFRNKATTSGGAITVGGCHGGQIYGLHLLSVFVNGSRIMNNKAPIDEQLSFSLTASIQISNTTIMQSGLSEAQQLLLVTLGMDALLTITNSFLQCGPGQRTLITDYPKAHSKEHVVIVTMTCATCPSADIQFVCGRAQIQRELCAATVDI
jgi:predicted outer membrane repeat protein